MNEKRFTFEYDDGQWGVPLFYDDGKKLCFDEVVDTLNVQQSTINEYKENWDNLVEKASEISKRNVVLDEEIGQLQRENKQLEQKIKDKNEYQRVLEAKIRRLKDRIKVLEKNE